MVEELIAIFKEKITVTQQPQLSTWRDGSNLTTGLQIQFPFETNF